jgi:hypothetical protein
MLKQFILLILLSVLIAQPIYSRVNDTPLSLAEAEKLALQNQAYSLPSKSLTELINQEGNSKQTEEGTDPHLELGLTKITKGNTPPWWKQDEANVVNIGVKQAFGAGDPMYLESEKSRTATDAAYFQHAAETRGLLNEVRNQWLKLFYLTQAAQLITAHQMQLTNLKNSTPHAQNQLNLELQSLNNQLITIQKESLEKRRQLARLIGKNNSQRPISEQLPMWAEPAALNLLKIQLQQHPKLLADRALIRASRAQTAFNKQQEGTKFEVTANYGMLQQDAMEANPRLDMLSAEVDMKLPTSPSQRPGIDIQRLEAAQQAEEKDYQHLNRSLKTHYDEWLKTSTQLNKIKPNQFAASKSMKLPYLIKAYRAQLHDQLQQLSLTMENAKARANLLYFEANKP